MAVEYYKLSSDQGNSRGQANYMHCLEDDLGVGDSTKAIPIQLISNEILVGRICSFHSRRPSVSAARILRLAKKCWPVDHIHPIFESIYRVFKSLLSMSMPMKCDEV
jgi:hypothetical protein